MFSYAIDKNSALVLLPKALHAGSGGYEARKQQMENVGTLQYATICPVVKHYPIISTIPRHNSTGPVYNTLCVSVSITSAVITPGVLHPFIEYPLGHTDLAILLLVTIRTGSLLTFSGSLSK